MQFYGIIKFYCYNVGLRTNFRCSFCTLKEFGKLQLFMLVFVDTTPTAIVLHWKIGNFLELSKDKSRQNINKKIRFA